MLFQPPAQINYEADTAQIVGKLRKKWELIEDAQDACLIVDTKPFVGEMTLTFSGPPMAIMHTNTFIRQFSNTWP